MNQTNINSRKESLVITCLLFLLLFIVLFFLKFRSQILIPQLEGGGGGNIAVNFGDSEFGSGKNMESVAPAKSTNVTQPSKEVVVEALLTNKTDMDVPAILEAKETDIKPTKTVEKPIVLEKPKVSKSTNDALANILKSNSKSGDGDNNVGGNKGKAAGSAKNNGYDGSGGDGNGAGDGNGPGSGLGTGTGYGSGMGNGRGNGAGNYLLSGRKALTKPNPKYDCNEQGIVVVQIKVNNAGRVIEATPGIKGTNNSASCLTSQAKIAALNTKFDANADAPEQQVGKIIYNFKLSN